MLQVELSAGLLQLSLCLVLTKGCSVVGSWENLDLLSTILELQLCAGSFHLWSRDDFLRSRGMPRWHCILDYWRCCLFVCSAWCQRTCLWLVWLVNVVSLWLTLLTTVLYHVLLTCSVPLASSHHAVAGVHLVISMASESAWKAATQDQCRLWGSVLTTVFSSWMIRCQVSSADVSNCPSK